MCCKACTHLVIMLRGSNHHVTITMATIRRRLLVKSLTSRPRMNNRLDRVNKHSTGCQPVVQLVIKQHDVNCWMLGSMNKTG